MFSFQRNGFFASAPTTTAEGLDQALQTRLARARLTRLLQANPEGLPAGVAAVCLIVLTMGIDRAAHGFQPSARAAFWALAMFVLLAHGQWLRGRLRRALAADACSASAGLRRVTTQAALLGAAWGSAAWLLLPAPSEAQLGLFVLALAAVLVVGTHGLGALTAAATAFGGALIAVFAGGLAHAGEALPLALGAGYALCGAAVLAVVLRERRSSAASIELIVKQDELLAERRAERQALDQARCQAREALLRAEEARQGRAGFVAALGHDLRQPVRALAQCAQQLRHVHDDEEAEATIGRIGEAVYTIGARLETLMMHASLSAGELQARSEAVDLGPLFERLEAHVRPLAEARGLKLRIDLRAGEVNGDAALLERALRHLADNALRFTPRGSIVIRAVARGAMTCILVADSGIGIGASQRRLLMKADEPIASGAGGLGLPIAQALAGLMGTAIRLRSLPGRGSSFALTLPSVVPAPAMASGSRRTRSAPDGVRGAFVVLMEADPLALDGLAGMLRSFGCRVLEAASGLEALHALARAEFVPQLVVADFRLGPTAGGGSGADAIRMVVENQAALYGSEFRLPALLVSGNTAADEIRQLPNAGYPVLHKSAGRERLHARIRAMLAAPAALSADLA